MERLAGFGSAVMWYRGRESNSTAPLCRRGALDQKATPVFLAVGAGFEPAHKLVNSQLPYRLATPQKLVGTSDSNRLRPHTLEQAAGVEPAFLRQDRSVLSVERRPHNWGDRRELNPRGQIHSLPPKPLGHGHTWCQEHESNVLVRLFRPAP